MLDSTGLTPIVVQDIDRDSWGRNECEWMETGYEPRSGTGTVPSGEERPGFVTFKRAMYEMCAEVVAHLEMLIRVHDRSVMGCCVHKLFSILHFVQS